MATQPIIMYLEFRKVLIFSVLLFIFVSVCFSACSEAQNESRVVSSGSRRRQLEDEEEMEYKPLKKKTTSQSSKNQTKLIKSNNTPSSKNQTKTIKSNTLFNKNQTKTVKSNNISTEKQTKTIKSDNISSMNQTKPGKVISNLSSKTTKTTTDTGLKKKLNSTTSALKNKLNSTISTTSKVKKLNSTSNTTTPTPTKKSLDLKKASNKTTKATTTTTTNDKDKNKQTKTTTTITKALDQTPAKPSKKPTKQSPPTSWMYEEDDHDLVSEITDLPNRFHKTLIPDLERISTTSRTYITKANNEITKGFKPYVGKKYASTVAAIISCAFILIPLLLVTLLCSRIKAYFSLQKILIFIQVYLSIYFTILCISSLVTGLEPLKFLYSTSQSTYLCLQVLQTLAYVLYLLMLLMYLVLVFSTECGLGSKFLGLAQTFVGFAIGLHYYVTVFHRVVLRLPPKTNWKVHGIYATCFLLICVFARAHRRKKAYVEDDGGKKGLILKNTGKQNRATNQSSFLLIECHERS